MKYLSTILLLAVWFVVSLTPKHLKAQDNILERTIHLEIEQKPLYKALMHINQITDYKVSYNSDLVNEDRKVSFSFEDISIKAILDSLFNDTTLVYDLVGRHIVIRENNENSKLVTDTTLKTKPEASLTGPLPNQREATKTDTNYTYKWKNDSSGWVLYNREIKLYKDSQLLVGILNERWNAQKNVWEPFDRSIKNYNEQGKQIESLHQQWSPEQNKWVNLKLKTFTYDRYGNKSEVLYHEWQQAAGQWYSTVRYLMEYNTFGEQKEILLKVYSPSTDSWSNETRYTFIYNDGIGPPSETLVESWNSFTESWDNRGRYYMDYNFRGNKIREIQSTWNQNMNRWMNGLRYLRNYDKMNLTSEIEQRWDYKANEWNNAIRDIFRYNEQGEVKKRIRERWNRDSSIWETQNIYFHSNMRNIQEQPPPNETGQ